MLRKIGESIIFISLWMPFLWAIANFKDTYFILLLSWAWAILGTYAFNRMAGDQFELNKCKKNYEIFLEHYEQIRSSHDFLMDFYLKNKD